MNLYPAIKGKMGRWQFYSVMMTMRELADNVNFAQKIYNGNTLDKAIQRVLNETRVKNEIASYLARQQDRFFSSIVVAAFDGEPKWYPMSFEDGSRPSLFQNNPRMQNKFGVLSFDGTQKYYAVDGQHRLAAIKALVDTGSDLSSSAPPGFKEEEISVIVVVPSELESTDEFLTRYRRLFSHLNRYAKSTDNATNIIMDEDDAFAILTRRLISEHEFFNSTRRRTGSLRVKTNKGKTLKQSDPYFTSLETLYRINITLLSTHNRNLKGWEKLGNKKLKEFIKFRPEDEQLESLYKELCIYWNAIIEELPILDNTPSIMRNLYAKKGDGRIDNNFLFWPVGQEVLAEIARDMMDYRLMDSANPTAGSVKKAVKGIRNLTWEAYEPPWCNLALIPDESGFHWRIRSQEWNNVKGMIRSIFRWQLGIDTLNKKEVTRLRDRWEELLWPALNQATIKKLWAKIEANVEY